MTFDMLLYLAPLLFIGVTALVLMLSAALSRSLNLSFSLSFIGLIISFASTFYVKSLPVKITDLFIVDDFGIFVVRLLLITSIIIFVFSYYYLKEKGEEAEEFFILFLISLTGAMSMVFSNHFFSFFLGVEILTVPIYALAAYFYQRSHGIEAAVKYIVLAGASAAFILFGMALLYAQLGSMEFKVISERLAPVWNSGHLVVLLGISFILVGVFFKLSVAPFHMWAPDVYEGAPLPVTAYLATVSKGAMLALFLRFFIQLDGSHIFEWQWIMAIVAVLSMFVGNLLALLQKNIKRLLAYSSIAHVGYMLAAIIADDAAGSSAILFYLVAYFVATLLAFGTLLILESKEKDFVYLADISGLFYVRPIVSMAMILAFLSLVGIPLTAGFIGKYWILLLGVQTAKWPLLFCLIVSSALGLYAYLQVVLVLFDKQENQNYTPALAKKSLTAVLTVLAIVILVLGVLPDFVTGFIQLASLG